MGRWFEPNCGSLGLITAGHTNNELLFCMLNWICEKKVMELFTIATSDLTWGYSSVGRASALQAEGQRFESVYFHADLSMSLNLRSVAYLKAY